MYNSARSQMAEAFLRHKAGDQFNVLSAGIFSRGINPYTIEVMKEIGINMLTHTSKSIKTYLNRFSIDCVITVSEEAHKSARALFPDVPICLNWAFPNPADAPANSGDPLKLYRKVRDEIEKHISLWLETQFSLKT